MRIDRLVVLTLVLLAACKPQQQVIGKYQEDLSVLRPDIPAKAEAPTTNANQVEYQSFVAPTGHIQSELDSLVRLSYQQNTAGKVVDGFKILIYSGTSRDEANTQRALFNNEYPELNAKVSYRQPNFRVKAGQFTNRLEAHRVYEEVKRTFKKAILIPERLTLVYERTEE